MRRLLKIKKAGFTIVELLIVIVIIGLLATIVIVAYNGVQDNARRTSLISDLGNASSLLALDLKQNKTYPSTLGLANGGNGIPASPNTTYQYIVGTSTSSPTFCLAATNGTYSYMTDQDGPPITGHCNLLANSSIEKTGTNEFLQYADLAPIFNLYGLVQYTVSFDIKSANITNHNSMQVYMQNGSSTKYSFVYATVPVTTSYVRQSLTGVAAISNASDTMAMLAFYGTYSTGNIPSVKNVKIEFGNTASAWTVGP